MGREEERGREREVGGREEGRETVRKRQKQRDRETEREREKRQRAGVAGEAASPVLTLAFPSTEQH